MESACSAERVNPLSDLLGSSEDPIGVWSAPVSGSGRLAAIILQAWDAFSRARTIVVDAGGLTLDASDVRALSRAATMGVRVVIAGSSGFLGFAPMMVLYEPDFARAAIASIYALGPAQSAILVSAAADAPKLTGIVRHAMRWRASFHDPENGDFTAHPS